MEMLCLMWEASPKGSLLINGKQPSEKLMASLCAVSIKEETALVAELEENGVFSRDEDGTIYSRRMRRDVEKALRDKANGGSGGNPGLTGKPRKGVNPPVNPNVIPLDNPSLKGGVKAQKPDARQNPSQQKGKSQDATVQDVPPDARPRSTLARANGSASTPDWDNDPFAEQGSLR